MKNIRMLTKEEATSKTYSFLKEKGLGASATDFYYLLGGRSEYLDEYDLEDETEESLKERFGEYWLIEDEKYDYQSSCIDLGGDIYYNSKDRFYIGCRPVVKYSEIKSSCYDKKMDGNVLIVTHGEYPQYAVSGNIKTELENQYEKDSLVKTGKIYTIYMPFIDYYDPTLNGYGEKELTEYIYKGKKYIRFEGLEDVDSGTLSTKEEVEEDNIYWIEVKPIRWLVDLERDIAIAEKVLFAGVQYYSEADRDYGEEREFKTSTIKKYLNTYFKKDIIAPIRRHENSDKQNRVRKGVKIKQINLSKIEEIVEEKDKSKDKVKVKAKKR